MHVLCFYYTEEHLLLLTHFFMVKVRFVLHKAKPAGDMWVKDQIFLVTLVCDFKF